MLEQEERKVTFTYLHFFSIFISIKKKKMLNGKVDGGGVRAERKKMDINLTLAMCFDSKFIFKQVIFVLLCTVKGQRVNLFMKKFMALDIFHSFGVYKTRK
jgi:hypothetical protein